MPIDSDCSVIDSKVFNIKKFPCCLLYDFLNPMRDDSILRGNERKRNIV